MLATPLEPEKALRGRGPAAATGQPLWRFPAGGAIFANPISYQSDGHQHIAIAAGHALISFALR